MSQIPTSKNIDGITDLVVIAPIKDDFIAAYENITYATRIKLVAEALNRVRVTAREYETIAPFSDVTERILTLLDFRIGVIDKDLFGLPDAGGAKGEWQSRRYLYLTATFDGAWEPYMRLIWDPLGPFLDLLFCNCEGYVTAQEHSFEQYAQWVRANQMDSSIFYAATGTTVRDQIYLSRLEQLQRRLPGEAADHRIARLEMPDPELAAKAERDKALADLANGDVRQYAKIHQMALEALTVLYRLADFYPPQWLAGQEGLDEGQYLARVARDLLLGWEELIPSEGPMKKVWDGISQEYREPLQWYRSGREQLARIEAKRRESRPDDPKLDPGQVQGGMLKPQGSREAPVRHGALMLMTVTDAAKARAFIRDELTLHFAGEDDAAPDDGLFRTIGFTASGLRRLGLPKYVVDGFPKEFREGMEARSGLVGDMRENHPRNWTLPRRRPAGGAAPARPLPPVEMGEVDLVIQLRTNRDDADVVRSEVRRLEERAAGGMTLQACQAMHSLYDDGQGISRDQFGFHDGVSQPRPVEGLGDDTPREPDQVRLGELLLGYRNDRGDFALAAAEEGDGDARRTAAALQRNGSYLVVRKLEQKIEGFEAFIAAEVTRINLEHPGLSTPMTPERLKAKLIGRHPDGRPLIPTADGSLNNFDYSGDRAGELCPFAAHIRRANPRNVFHGRPAPRLLRRGMAFDDSEEEGGKGLVFMAYNASIAEQYETIQRWINGGNSTDVASGHNDPLMGVAPRTGALDPAERVFRFVEESEVIRVRIPEAFVALHWGLYLFVPSRDALDSLCRRRNGYQPMEATLETHGRAVMQRMRKIRGTPAEPREWKRLLEDFDAKDPAEKNISPDVWAAIRYYRAGAIRIEGTGSVQDEARDRPMVLCASWDQGREVLSNWKLYSTEEQLKRIEGNSGPIFVTQQPEDAYRDPSLRGRYDYRTDATATNQILMDYGRARAFGDGYRAAQEVLAKFLGAARGFGQDYYELELRREFILPALGALCRTWYGMPDGINLHAGGWQWTAPDQRDPQGPRCPGDFLSPSRNAFYPAPSETVRRFAEVHGAAILEGSAAFVEMHRSTQAEGVGTVAEAMFKATPDDAVLARNLVGTMVGAIPPMDGNLRGILLEWLNEKTLWRHQAALLAAMGDTPAGDEPERAMAVLVNPVSQAMCKRPAPDLLYRTATEATVLRSNDEEDRSHDLNVEAGDMVVVSLVSATQRSLHHDADRGEVSIVFGGKRRAAYETEITPEYPVHACPAQDMAMGAIMGILAALLDAGRIQALPASLIVRVSEWR